MTIASFQRRVRARKLNTVQGEHAVENLYIIFVFHWMAPWTPLFIMESVTALVFPFLSFL